MKIFEREPTWESTPYNFDSTDDLMKASTIMKRHTEALGIPLATLSKKWPRSHLNHPFQILNTASSI